MGRVLNGLKVGEYEREFNGLIYIPTLQCARLAINLIVSNCLLGPAEIKSYDSKLHALGVSVMPGLEK